MKDLLIVSLYNSDKSTALNTGMNNKFKGWAEDCGYEVNTLRHFYKGSVSLNLVIEERFASVQGAITSRVLAGYTGGTYSVVELESTGVAYLQRDVVLGCSQGSVKFLGYKQDIAECGSPTDDDFYYTQFNAFKFV